MIPVADPLSLELWPESLRRAFETLPPHACWTVALSGGLDSVLLLHLAHGWRQASDEAPALRALHVNHGLQPGADMWADHCRVHCEKLGIPLDVVAVTVERDRRESLEDAARKARYRVFADRLGEGDALLLAHHADDQAETQLYRILRGAGLAGFAAMPEARALGKGYLFRPLLAQTRQRLRQWAERADLTWVDDPSNRDDRYDRNFLRNRVIPLLRTRWPAVSGRLAQNARHGREALVLLDERARDDAALVLDRASGDLLLEPLRALSGPRQRNLVQWWLRQCGLAPMTEKHLLKTLPGFLEASEEAHPSIVWSGLVLRRYQGRVLVLDEALVSASSEPVTWHPPETLQWAGGRLMAEPVAGQGLIADSGSFQVQPRRGGEKIELPNGRHQPLKKWLQARRFAPWERAALPLLWSGDTLVAVADCWFHPRYRAGGGQTGWRLSWRPPEFRAVSRRSRGLSPAHSD